jgi:hypothetical protein
MIGKSISHYRIVDAVTATTQTRHPSVTRPNFHIQTKAPSP